MTIKNIILSDYASSVLRKAIEAYGEESQEDLAIGEIGELLTLVGRRAQGRFSKKEWISEIADVSIMMAQLRVIHGEAEVDQEIENKLSRLEKRIANYRLVGKRVLIPGHGIFENGEKVEGIINAVDGEYFLVKVSLLDGSDIFVERYRNECQMLPEML